MKHEKYMQLALELAEKGKGKTSPNPMVGALVVKNGRILATGYHKKFGGPHAEATALKFCGNKAKGAILYINLEPCSHFGKTPPCTDLIIKSGIKEVVCATIDPNPQVNGKGIKSLKKKGVDVKLGVLEQEAKKLNEIYFKYITTKLPFVMLEVVQTLDGRIIQQTEWSKSEGREISAQIMRIVKPGIDAVLCDANTGGTDYLKPFLDSDNSSNPKLILAGIRPEISSKLRKIRKDLHKNIVLVPTDLESAEGIKQNKFRMWRIKKRRNGEIDPVALLKRAGEDDITSLLIVGGGSYIATSFLKQRLVDKIWYFISPYILGKGEEPFGDLGIRKISDSVILKNSEYKQFKDGLLVVGYPAEAGSTS